MSEIFTFASSKERLPEFLNALASLRKFHPHTSVLLTYCGTDQLEIDGVEVVHYCKPIDPLARLAGINLAILKGYEKIIALDNDMELFTPLTHIFTLLDAHNAVVTPHNLAPLPDDGKFPSMENIVHAGNYNSGFFACRATPETKAWMKWWTEQTVAHPELNGPAGHFAEQGWLRFIADYLPNTHILRHTSYNVAYWNIFQRNFRKEGNTWYTTDGPLSLFHYSGLDFAHPEKMSNHQDRWVATGDMLEFYQAYARKFHVNS